MQLEVRIPYWAEDEEDQDYILFIAFLYKLNQIYGYKHTYRIESHDIRTILGVYMDNPEKHIKLKPWAKHITISNLGTDALGYSLNNLRLPKALKTDGKSSTISKYLTDQRCIMVWIYLLGAFNNNLIQEEGYTEHIGLQRDYRYILNGMIKN